jgi:UTP--glucose-1-phosphate uridylyltransferase
MGVAGRYVLTPRILTKSATSPRAWAANPLTDAIARLMAHEAVYAYQYSGKRYDCGSKGLS